jgi:putative FmdB family regulatory protein
MRHDATPQRFTIFHDLSHAPWVSFDDQCSIGGSAHMPMYDYRCKACGAHFEAWQKFTDDPISVCPTCSGPAQRVIHAAGIMFKGSGFYSTDSRSHSSIPPNDATAPAAADGATSEKGEKAGKAEHGAGESGASKPAAAESNGSSGSSAPAAQTTPATKAS